MAWRGSITRAMMSTSTARSSLSAASRSTARIRSPPLSAPRFTSRRLGNPRTFGELGCAQSLLSVTAGGARMMTSHLTANVRAFCELSHGTRSCQDR